MRLIQTLCILVFVAVASAQLRPATKIAVKLSPEDTVRTLASDDLDKDTKAQAKLQKDPVERLNITNAALQCDDVIWGRDPNANKKAVAWSGPVTDAQLEQLKACAARYLTKARQSLKQ